MSAPGRLLSGQLMPLLRDQATIAWPLWAGACAAVLAAWLLFGPAAHWQAQADEQLAVASRASLLPPARAAAPAVLAAPDLPNATQSPDRSARLARLARRHGVQLQRLREQFDAAGQLQLSLSGQAPYASWRAFVAAALAADPALALDRLRLQRADADSVALDADTQWTFLHQGAGAPVAGATPRRGEAR